MGIRCPTNTLRDFSKCFTKWEQKEVQTRVYEWLGLGLGLGGWGEGEIQLFVLCFPELSELWYTYPNHLLGIKGKTKHHLDKKIGTIHNGILESITLAN
jgi:hypothetical protein